MTNTELVSAPRKGGAVYAPQHPLQCNSLQASSARLPAKQPVMTCYWFLVSRDQEHVVPLQRIIWSKISSVTVKKHWVNILI